MREGDLNPDALDTLLDQALARRPEIVVPPGFSRRVAARAHSERRSLLPWTIGASCVIFALWTAWLLTSGAIESPSIWRVLAGAAALETGATAAWLHELARG